MSDGTEDQAFTDADELEVPGDVSPREILRSLLRADLSGDTPGAVLRAFDAAPPAQREAIAAAWAEAVDDDLHAFIEADPARRRAAERIVLHVAPRDRSLDCNAASLPALQGFTAWQDYPYAVLIVPGYTPLDSTTATPGVHPTARRRLEQAIADLDAGKAPFLLVTGGNVYPRGTPYYEAIEMKSALLALGVAEEKILVEARARHSTTNLRNAGRVMRAHGMRAGLIVTMGGGVGGSDFFGQDFYFSNPTLSTFHARCKGELGYRVGELREVSAQHIELVPAPEVSRTNLRDALDP